MLTVLADEVKIWSIILDNELCMIFVSILIGKFTNEKWLIQLNKSWIAPSSSFLYAVNMFFDTAYFIGWSNNFAELIPVTCLCTYSRCMTFPHSRQTKENIRLIIGFTVYHNAYTPKLVAILSTDCPHSSYLPTYIRMTAMWNRFSSFCPPKLEHSAGVREHLGFPFHFAQKKCSMTWSLN